MPVYEYYCRQCDATFERLVRRAASDAPSACPAGHADAARTLSVFATFSPGTTPTAAPAMGGDCCGGGGCACAAARN